MEQLLRSLVSQQRVDRTLASIRESLQGAETVRDLKDGARPRPKALLRLIKAAAVLEQTPEELEQAIRSSPEALSLLNTIWMSKSRKSTRITPLIFTIHRPAFWKYVPVLLRCGANANMSSGSKASHSLPLFFAALLNALCVVRHLLDAGADVTARDAENNNIVEFLARYVAQGVNVDPAAVLLLLLTHAREKGVLLAPPITQVTVPSLGSGRGIVVSPAPSQQPQQVPQQQQQQHVPSGVLDLNATHFTPSGKTPLGVFVRCDQPATVMVLLMFGANPNCYDKESFTPLHTACQRDDVANITLLTLFGASNTMKNKDGKVPSDLLDGQSAVPKPVLADGIRLQSHVGMQNIPSHDGTVQGGQSAPESDDDADDDDSMEE